MYLYLQKFTKIWWNEFRDRLSILVPTIPSLHGIIKFYESLTQKAVTSFTGDLLARTE